MARSGGFNEHELVEPGSGTVIKAAMSGTVEQLKKALDAGGDVNEKDSRGNTALYYAAQSNQLDKVILLFRNGADPNIKNLERESIMDLISKREDANADTDTDEGKKVTQVESLFALYDYIQTLNERIKKGHTKTTGDTRLDKVIHKIFPRAEVGFEIAPALEKLQDLWNVRVMDENVRNVIKHEQALKSYKNPIITSLYNSLVNMQEAKETAKQERRIRGRSTMFSEDPTKQGQPQDKSTKKPGGSGPG